MSVNPRRSTRIVDKKQAVNSTGTPDSGTPKKLKKNKSTHEDGYHNFENNDELMEELENIEQILHKPTELFLENDVDGKNMYPVIGTSIKKGAMIQKAIMCRDSQVPSGSSPENDVKSLRICLAKVSKLEIEEQWNIKQRVSDTKKSKNNVQFENVSEREIDIAEASNESSPDDARSSESANSDYNNKENKGTNRRKVPQKDKELQSLPNLRRNRTRIAEGYHLKTDEYFATQSEKSITSNHTLSRLKNRHLDEEKLQQLLANNSHISKAHKEKLQKMSETLEKRYTELFHVMEEGFTVLLYGLGSKRLLINNFHKQMIPDEPTLIINGFFPSLTLKEILDNIIVELLGLEPVTNTSECFDIIEKTMKTYPDDRIYLLINNLDGAMLRSNKAQDMLSRLASIANVHILASVDHVNAPLIWDNVKRARYNFYWMDATTFLPYEAETSYESSLLVQKSGALALLSLQNVFASLTTNAKAIYILLVKYQLENGGNNYTGMAFKDLYRESREGFLVSSDQALRAQLTEFIDHKLVKTKRNIDGVECLVIPLDDALLKQFLEQHDEAS